MKTISQVDLKIKPEPNDFRPKEIPSVFKWPKYEILTEQELKNLYNIFVLRWKETHKISPAPSFTSWKKYYINN